LTQAIEDVPVHQKISTLIRKILKELKNVKGNGMPTFMVVTVHP
jgi:hypothetical protein